MLEGVDKSYYEAIVKSEELWEWMCDNPTLNKLQFPKYKKYEIHLMVADCPLCEYHYPNKDVRCKDKCVIDKECSMWCSTCSNDLESEVAVRKATYFKLLEERLRIM